MAKAAPTSARYFMKDIEGQRVLVTAGALIFV